MNRALWQRLFPFLRWWPQVDRHSLRADLVAGLVGALIVLPQGVAFATLAGLPPAYGLYCAIGPTIVAGLYGSSMHTVSGPTNALSLMTFAALAPLAAPGSEPYVQLAATLAFLTGLCMLALGALRLGLLVNFISQPVIVGFTAGAGVLILVSQLGPLTGIAVPQGTSFAGTLVRVLGGLGETKPAVVAVALATVVVGWAVRRWRPGWPAVVLAMLGGVALAHALNLLFGIERTGIAMLEPIPRRLPPFSLPNLAPRAVGELSGVAVAVAIVSLTQSVSIAKAIALRTGQRIDGNQEFIGQGLSNLAAGLFSGFPTSASVNRSGPNLEAGAVTPMAAVFAGLLLAIIVLLFAPLVAWLPLPAVAGVLCLAGWSLIDFERIRATRRMSRAEGGVLLLTLASTLVMRLEVAVLIGVATSLVLYLNRTSRPTMRSLVPDGRVPERPFVPMEAGRRECPQLKIMSVEGSIYFGAVNHVATHFDTLREFATAQKHLLLHAGNVNFVDVAGADLLVAEARRREAGGGALYLYGLRPQVEAFLARGASLEAIGADRIFASKHAAIAEIFERLDRDVCRRCTARIFYECQQVEPPPTGPESPGPR
ncbi:MAG: SulP family inorganic anion transporter [Burkholderiales bacterium]|nr:MAG: SulP family inorganic anion transporter [Burkholderiales bacterium]